MAEAGFISAADREQAVAEKLNFRRPGSEHLGPYFVEYIRYSSWWPSSVKRWCTRVDWKVTTLNADKAESG